MARIFLARREPTAFTRDQITLVETFAQQAAIAINNVRLFNKPRRRWSSRRAVAEILRVISSSPTDVQPVLDAIADRAIEPCGASAASIHLTDGNVLRHVASKGESPEEATATAVLPISRDSISGRAVLEHKTIHVRDVARAGVGVSRRRGDLAPHRQPHAAGDAALPRGPALRHDPAATQGGARLQRARDRAAQDVRRPGGDCDRERPPVQRDQGGARPAARVRRGPRRDQQFASPIRRPSSRRSSTAASGCSPARWR